MHHGPTCASTLTLTQASLLLLKDSEPQAIAHLLTLTNGQYDAQFWRRALVVWGQAVLQRDTRVWNKSQIHHQVIGLVALCRDNLKLVCFHSLT